ncbi:GTA-gp10 family protein [Gimibacter soli]|uniref:GTA-gp10 family protein n=1 Tax=Gimibacter soli TaxID=3024400 RepID=A0AAE9XRS3_9PROT|nr:GTA-gp10 family protein [Gimibacter soli]WCL55087.1 GTA-gp10 family protein [Gimibacter soli]
MARQISGEVSLKVGRQVRRLRLEIGGILDLEDHFDMGLVPLLTTRLPECRLGDLAALLVAMTGGAPADEGARRTAAADIHEAGIATAAKAIARCLELTFSGSECSPVVEESVGKKPVRGRRAPSHPT